ncbi:MAG: FliI/YscN family ATPase [bacterium]|nr:FliI/YscN family ATPase [bacterium]
MGLFDRQTELVQRALLMRVTGRVKEVTGLTVTAEGLPIPLGSMCEVVTRCGDTLAAQVVGFQSDTTLLMPLVQPQGVAVGDRVTSSGSLQAVPVGRQMLGRVLDGLGRTIDDRSPFRVEAHYPVFADPPGPLERRPIEQALATGIRSIDALAAMGAGQRMGVFAGTGVGKSVLMGMIARNTSADVTVVALVGERGREVSDFIRKDLGEEGMRKTVLVVSTSDESPVLRVRACFLATAVAEYFRDQGADVLLMMDSVTRMAMAQRQIGLAAGEPPATKGYPPSTFALLPRLLERAGRTPQGSITGLYTVLVEGDDITEPVSDAARGVLDGHVWLSRSLANRGHYPAVAVLESISRVMVDVADEEQIACAQSVRRVLAVWADIEDLVNIGAYAAGANVDYDLAVQMKPRIDEFLRQGIGDRIPFGQTRAALLELGREIETVRTSLTSRGVGSSVKQGVVSGVRQPAAVG